MKERSVCEPPFSDLLDLFVCRIPAGAFNVPTPNYAFILVSFASD
jgi:hypothetical protein